MPRYHDSDGSVTLSHAQRLVARYVVFVLVDLCVLGLLAEFWDKLYVDGFLTTLAVAVVLQITLKITLALKKWVKARLASRKVLKWLGIWAISFSSKFVILAIVEILFGSYFEVYGIKPFFAVLIAILLAEYIALRLFWASFLRVPR